MKRETGETLESIDLKQSGSFEAEVLRDLIDEDNRYIAVLYHESQDDYVAMVNKIERREQALEIAKQLLIAGAYRG